MSAEKKQESIYLKLSRVQSKIGAIHKDAKNLFHESTYESLEAILSVVSPLITEEGMALFSNVENLESGMILKTILTDGKETIEVFCPLSADGKNLMQAYGSAISYARRYNLRNLFNLITTDDDGEGAHDRSLKQVKEKPKTKNGQYIIPKECRQFSGKTFKDIEPSLVEEYIKNIVTFHEEKGRALPSWFIAFTEEFTKFKGLLP